MNKIFLSLALAGALLTLGGVPMAAQETQGADEVFKALDNNKDGKLSQGEFYRLFDMQGETTATSDEKEKQFKSWDADGDGSVSKAEFDAKYGG